MGRDDGSAMPMRGKCVIYRKRRQKFGALTGQPLVEVMVIIPLPARESMQETTEGSGSDAQVLFFRDAQRKCEIRCARFRNPA
jgi:hypothetical protein